MEMDDNIDENDDKICNENPHKIIDKCINNINNIINKIEYISNDKIKHKNKINFNIYDNTQKFAKLFTISDKVLKVVGHQKNYMIESNEILNDIYNKSAKLCDDCKDETSLIKNILYHLFPEDRLFGMYLSNDYAFLDKFNDRIKQALINQINVDKIRNYNSSNYCVNKIYGGLETIDDCIDILTYINDPDHFLILTDA
jgi:hypothetical protein